MTEQEHRIDRNSRQLELNQEHEKRWKGMSDQINKEYKTAVIRFILYIVVAIVAIGLTYYIWNSNLPTWVKAFLT